MAAKITFDTREFNRALRDYRTATKKDLEEIVLRKGLDLAYEALKATHHADANRIAAEMAKEVTYVEKTSKKTGKVSVRRKLSFGKGDEVGQTLAGRIVNARRVRAGEKPLFGKELAAAVRKLVGARIKSVNFVKSGWLGAIQKLGPLVGRAPRVPGVKAARPKGTAVVQRGLFSPAVIVINRAMQTLGEGNNRLKQVAEVALAAGVAAVVKDIRQYIERKLQKSADRFNSRR